MLASDILPPRTVSSRGMKRMLDRLETDSPGNYIFKLAPPSPFCEAKGGRGAQRSRGLGGSTSPSRSVRGREQAKRSSQGMPGDERRAGQSQPITKISVIRGSDFPWLPKSALKSPTGPSALIHQERRIPVRTPTSHRTTIPNPNRSRNHQPRNPPTVHRPTLTRRHHPHPLRLRSHRHRPRRNHHHNQNRHPMGTQQTPRRRTIRQPLQTLPRKMGPRILRQVSTPSHRTLHQLPPPHRPPNLRRRQTRHQPIPPTRQPTQQPLRPHPNPTPKHPTPKPQRPKRRSPSNLVIHHLRTSNLNPPHFAKQKGDAERSERRGFT